MLLTLTRLDGMIFDVAVSVAIYLPCYQQKWWTWMIHELFVATTLLKGLLVC
jgi:hypothetical protein